MRIRATLHALAVRLDGGETPEALRKALADVPNLPLEVEVCGTVGVELLQALAEIGQERGITLRPPRGERSIPYTEVVDHTLRAGTRIESPGTVVVLGDVNAGAEVIAGGDVIVVGKLRGLAHAGATGQEEATIWAMSLEAKQIRIAQHFAQAPAGSTSRGPERARVVEGAIVLEPWGRKKS
ncbi:MULTISPECIES: septum site-determining protein MinC [unclassified Meiothermus]|uniref:septum site-determining protein MinC n=1 Tax=unclassified Meiothermus TaxID=370471 RepID=UPI000D7CA4AB|nr:MULTISPECIES: septum site-determining protein MinC [unclassified Meiothermus]PZA06739.1 septum site-determining protein MinC [Meiothermus sp. Pnk-1]RYM36664.1 septum site-determining protein MinC [Meiothermus sp. PNK-Is4]